MTDSGTTVIYRLIGLQHWWDLKFVWSGRQVRSFLYIFWIYSYFGCSQSERFRTCFILLAGWSLLWGTDLSACCKVRCKVYCKGKKNISLCTRTDICENCYLFHHDKFIYTGPVSCLILKFHLMFSIRVVLCFLSPLCINGAVICSIANMTRYYYFKHRAKVSWNLYSSVL